MTGEQQGWRQGNNIIRRKVSKPQQCGVEGQAAGYRPLYRTRFSHATEMMLGAVIGGGRFMSLQHNDGCLLCEKLTGQTSVLRVCWDL